MSAATQARPDRIGLIWAQTTDGVIGADGGMPWHLPEDLRHFKHVTRGQAVIMGRKTWESFPDRFRPLPDRANIVISRSPDYEAPGATVVGSLDEALAEAARQRPYEIAWVIGGERVFREALPLADELEVTEIDLDVPGDTFAPELDDDWVIVESEPADGWTECSGGQRVRWMTLRRTDPSDADD